MIDWTPTPETAAGVTTMPPVATTLANDADEWTAIGLIKAVQRKAGLAVTGSPNQATWDAANRFMKGQ